MYQIFPGVYEIPAQNHSMQEGQALEEKRKQIFKRIDEAYELSSRGFDDNNAGKAVYDEETPSALYFP